MDSFRQIVSEQQAAWGQHLPAPKLRRAGKTTNGKLKKAVDRLSPLADTSLAPVKQTDCTLNREYLFGGIVDGCLQLNDAGEMICCRYGESENKFPDIQCDVFVCMSNHVHCIVVNLVRADLRVRPD